MEALLKTPDREDCAKRLFGECEKAFSVSLNTSEYFSQSSDENGGGCQAYPSPQGWDVNLATPSQSPACRASSFSTTSSASSSGSPMCESPPLKLPRLFTPPLSPTTRNLRTPLNFDLSSPPAPRGAHQLNNSMLSPTTFEVEGEGTPLPFRELTNVTAGHSDAIFSPPKIERLRLFDYPATPQTLARGSSGPARESFLTRVRRSGKLTRSGPELRRKVSRGINVNPFTPQEYHRTARKRVQAQVVSMTSSLEESTENVQTVPLQKLALKENNISRYREEFKEVCRIGCGSFGTVYKCINRLDGCVYALKKSHKPVAGSVDEAAALREVCAHAVLGSHLHLVRYYSAWAEENHMIIQNEFCNGGNLSSVITQYQAEGSRFTEGELKRLTRHISMALQYIHSLHLVHLDIKPDNVFISFPEQPTLTALMQRDEMEEDGEGKEIQLLYKLGDMGHVTSTTDPQVEEGDCRFLPREILQDDYQALPKADIFSLGLTVFCAGSCSDLPKNGPEWHAIRNGHLAPLDHCTAAFNTLLLRMIQADPAKRPTATELLVLCSACPSTKSKAQLCKELNEEKFKNVVLMRQLQEANKQGSVGGRRLVVGGAKVNRSMSIA